jgi:hypothetical protein
VFRSNTRYDGSIVYADLRVARTVKTVLDIADYEGEIEELEISNLLELLLRCENSAYAGRIKGLNCSCIVYVCMYKLFNVL